MVWATRFVVSGIVLVGVLAILAAIPVLGLYVLGYFLEAEGRVGRGERWRNVLPWIRYAPRVAAIAVGTTAVVLPILVFSDFARDATLVNPTGGTARVLRGAVWLTAAIAVIHLFLAYARGGSLLSFVRPIKNVRVGFQNWRSGQFGRSIADRLFKALAQLQFLALFWMGARGLAVAFVWLFVPCALIAAAGPADTERLFLKFGGAFLLTVAFPMLLIAQAHFAVQNRLRSGFAPIQTLRLFGRAPMAWLIAGLVTAGLALPLFLFKIVAPPRDAFWMLTPLFVSAMLPARLITGWAYRRAARRDRRRHVVMIGLATVGLFAVGSIYSTGVFVAQYINEHGRHAVFEQHAFGLPVPF
ncbi:MAG: hypothetical protein WBC44_09785 [Planctomycetaceae bacterium]